MMPSFNLFNFGYGAMSSINPFACHLAPGSIFSGYNFYNHMTSAFSFINPTYNFMPSLTSYISQTVSRVTSSARRYAASSSGGGRSSSTAASVGSSQNTSAWAKLGYCAKAGIQLAKTALNSAVGFIGYCARYVKNAIAKCGLGQYVSGNACDMVNIMRNNKKFKEINPSGVNLKTLPAGCVLVYGRGVAGYSSKYGHVEIATGDGRCVSDGITRNPRGVPTAIFMPVSA